MTAVSPQLVMGTVGISAASGGLLGLAVVLPFVVDDFNIQPAVAALVMPAIYVGCSATSVLGGTAADRWGGARVSAAGLALMTVGVLIASLTGSMMFYLVGASVTGTGYGVVNPATSVMVDPGRSRGRGVLLSVKQAGVTLGGALSGIILPVVAEQHGWPIALASAAGVQAIIAIAMIAVPTGVRGSQRASAPAVAEEYRLRPSPGSLFGLMMAGAQITVFGLLAVYLTQDLGLSHVLAGIVFGAVLGLAVAARIVWGTLSDRRPHNRSLPLQWCALLGMIGFMALSVPLPIFVIIGSLLIGGGASAWNGAYLAAVVSSTSSGEGAALGRALLLINIGCIAGPLLGSAILASTHSWIVLWMTMACAQAIGLIAVTRATEVGSPVLI